MIFYFNMAKLIRRIVISLALAILVGVHFLGVYYAAFAQTSDRQTTIIVPYTEYEWWLIRWNENQISCRILVDHEGIPTADEVLKACSAEIYNDWLATPPCKQIVKGEQDTSACSGYYMFLASSKPAEREVIIDLPEPIVWVDLEGCSPVPPDNYCATLPSLLLVGEEPLPNEKITAIQGTYDGLPFYCDGERCNLPLKSTPVEGVIVEFWADSSFGDSSQKFTAQVRVVDSGVSTAPGGGGYYVDVLSTQWRGEPLTSCAKTWEVFPPIGGLPDWLSTPDQTDLLFSDEAYYYLAGRLIAQGVVDASSCATTGLLPNGYADACGLEKAHPVVEQWQNQFDERIIEVSQESSIPAQLLKNLFAQESQFWPGVFRVPYEFGLGQITDKGADAILLWNQDFFDQFCPLVLAEDACSKGYLKLKAPEQAILRGALALEANSNCADCPAGVDLSHANMSVSLFASTLKANCEQVSTLVNTATDEMPGKVSSYEDLWRFTVANYHAGPGCLSYAIHMAWQSNPGPLTWEKVSAQFTEACRGVVPYVEKISR
jgi:hypothetical protein